MPATIIALVATAVSCHHYVRPDLSDDYQVFVAKNHLEDIKRYKTDYPAESHITFVNLSSMPDSASGGTVAGSSGSGLAALMANGDD
ncbi:hypothetical protein F5146DRAFT_1067804 [Armillaria mellea]|nr:hypothetical protein F5146DRAFT_1067804 [Armillaria mellea]